MAKEKPNSGRRTKLTTELINEICSYVENGNTNKDAAILSNVGESTFYLWLQKAEEDKKAKKESIYMEFLESLKKALVTFKAYHIQQVTKAAKDPRYWAASMTLLERKFPEEFGRRLDIKGKFDVTNFDVTLSPEDEEAYNERLKDLYDLEGESDEQ